MEIYWTMPNGKKRKGRIEAQVLPYVEALGLEVACELFLKLGGTEIYISPKGKNSIITRTFGEDVAEKIVRANPRASGPIRLPMGNVFLARYLRSKGMPIVQIARTMRVTDITVRMHLDTDEARRSRSQKYKNKLYGLED